MQHSFFPESYINPTLASQQQDSERLTVQINQQSTGRSLFVNNDSNITSGGNRFRIDDFRQQLSSSLKHNAAVRMREPQQQQQHLNIHQQEEQPPHHDTDNPPEEIWTIDSDCLFICDSNGQGIDPNRMGDATCQKVWSARWCDVIAGTSTMSVQITPAKVLLNVGINDLGMPSINITNNIDKAIAELRKHFRGAQLYFCNILYRKDGKFEDQCDELNKYFSSLAKGNSDITFIDHRINVDPSIHMRDTLHLNNKGIHVFIANIKFALFGILPSVPSSGGRGRGGRGRKY